MRNWAWRTGPESSTSRVVTALTAKAPLIFCTSNSTGRRRGAGSGEQLTSLRNRNDYRFIIARFLDSAVSGACILPGGEFDLVPTGPVLWVMFDADVHVCGAFNVVSSVSNDGQLRELAHLRRAIIRASAVCFASPTRREIGTTAASTPFSRPILFNSASQSEPVRVASNSIKPPYTTPNSLAFLIRHEPSAPIATPFRSGLNVALFPPIWI